MKNPNEPKLDKIKLIPRVSLTAKTRIKSTLDKNNPLIRLLKNEPNR